MVRAYVAALCREPWAVDDLSQEVFVRALERAHAIRHPDDPGRFLRGIARHVVKEHFRRRRRDRLYTHMTLEGVVANDDTVIQALLDREQRDRLAAAIEALPLVARRMLEMRYHDGLNAVVIGDRLGISPGAVRAALLRVRQRLRRALESHGPGIRHHALGTARST